MSADVVFLYDQILETFSRLHCLQGNDEEREIDGDVGDDVTHMTSLLAKRDLLIFASTTRNFAEATKSIEETKKHSIRLSEIYFSNGPPFFRDKRQALNLYQALSRILHSHDSRVISSPFAFIAETSTGSYDFIARLKERENFLYPVDPLMKVSTQKEGPSYFKLRRLLEGAAAYLQVMTDRLAEEDTFLQRNLRDG